MSNELIELGGPIRTQHITITAIADNTTTQDPDHRFELEQIRLTGYLQYMDEKPPAPGKKKMPFMAIISRQQRVRTEAELEAYRLAPELHGKEKKPSTLGTIDTRANLTSIGVSLRPQQYDRLAVLAQQQALKGIILTYEFDESKESGFSVVSLTTTTDPEFMANEYEDRYFSGDEYTLPG